MYHFRPSKPRRRIGRVLFGIVGIAVLLLMLVFGLIIGAGMLVFGGVRRLIAARRADSQTANSQIIDAEYSVVRTPDNLFGPR